MGDVIEGVIIDQNLSKEDKRWGMFCHIASFAGFIIPFGNIIGPLILWLVKKDTIPFVDYNGKEVVNFQITILIAMAISMVLALIFIGFILMYVIGIFDLVVTIVGTIKTAQGEYYRYPLNLRIIK